MTTSRFAPHSELGIKGTREPRQKQQQCKDAIRPHAVKAIAQWIHIKVGPWSEQTKTIVNRNLHVIHVSHPPAHPLAQSQRGEAPFVPTVPTSLSVLGSLLVWTLHRNEIRHLSFDGRWAAHPHSRRTRTRAKQQSLRAEVHPAPAGNKPTTHHCWSRGKTYLGQGREVSKTERWSRDKTYCA